MDFEQLFKDLKNEIVALASTKFGNDGKAILADMETYLTHSKEKLKKWTQLFVEGKIDKDELTWLLKSQKDLLVLKTLEQTGISKISLGHFKNKVISTVLSKIVLLAL